MGKGGGTKYRVIRAGNVKIARSGKAGFVPKMAKNGVGEKIAKKGQKWPFFAHILHYFRRC